MVELARALRSERLVRLGRIAKITGLSENYLAQLALSLKNNGLLIGVSGKKGGYQLAKPVEDITIGQIIQAVSGPVVITECVAHPDICLNSSFCESRAVWTLIYDRVTEVMNEFTLADLIDKNWLTAIRASYPNVALLNPDVVMSEDHWRAENQFGNDPGCPGFES
jgi:Rrf2 family protein